MALSDSDWLYAFLKLLIDRVGSNPNKMQMVTKFVYEIDSELKFFKITNNGRRKKYLSDLSLSGLVKLIDGDKEKGKEALIEIANKHEELLTKERKLKAELSAINTELGLLKSGAENVLRHLKILTPMAVILKDKIIIIYENDIVIEKNVI